MEATQDKPTAGDAGVGDAVIGKPSKESAGADAAAGETGATSQKREDAKPINLDELPEFRRFKSKIDKEREKERRAMEERVARMEEEAKRYRSLVEQNLSPAELRELQASDYRSELEKERQARRELEMMIAKQSALAELSNQYGVPLEELDDVETPAEAYQRILERKTREYADMQERIARIEREMQARTAATSAVPVVGGDATSSAGAGSLQRQYDEAALARDTKRMDEIIMLATREGVKLDKLSVFKNKRGTVNR